MLKSGICQLDEKHFNKCIAFQDINYQLALEEDKDLIFNQFANVLNSFDPSVDIEFSYVNQLGRNNELKAAIQIPDKNDGYDDIRLEFREMLKSQLAKGNNGLKKSKYITFGVEADSLEQATAKLERLEIDILSNLKSMGVRAEGLTGTERLKILHDILNPDKLFSFSYKDLKPRESTKTVITPDSFNFVPNKYFKFGKYIGAVSHLQILASELSDRMLAEFLDIDDNINISFHIKAVEQTEAIKMVKRKNTDIDKMKIEENKKAVRSGYDMDILPSDLITYGDNIKMLLKDLQTRDERMFIVTIVFMNFARTVQKLDTTISQISSIASKHNCKIKRLDHSQEQGFVSVLPLGVNKIEIDRGLVGGSVIGAAKLGEVTSTYLSSGSNENVSVEAAEKGLGSSSKLIHGVKNYSDKRKGKKLYDLEKSDRKIQSKKSKLEFRKSVDEVRKTDQYKKANAYKKFQKKKQMKSAIYKQNKTRIRDRVKKTLMDTFKVSKDFIIRKAKEVAIIMAAIIIFGTFVFNFASMTMGGFANSTSSVLTTSYLSRPNVLTEINQSFSNKENDLYSELENVEKNNPVYDEYIVRKNGDIGHNVHELLSYITSRCGEVKSLSEVSNILDDLFKTMYHVDYKEEIEIRYKSVTETYTDEDGNEYTESHEEPYEYRKLIVTLSKREMDSVVREVFAKYPDNLKHYEALFLAQGNMGEMFGNTNLITARASFKPSSLANALFASIGCSSNKYILISSPPFSYI